MPLIIKSRIKETVKQLDKENNIGSVAEEVGLALERKTQELLEQAIKRAKANNRRTLLGRDL